MLIATILLIAALPTADAPSLDQALIPFHDGSAWGYRRPYGRTAVPPRFDAVSRQQFGFSVARTGDRFAAVVAKSGAVVSLGQGVAAWPFGPGLAVLQTSQASDEEPGAKPRADETERSADTFQLIDLATGQNILPDESLVPLRGTLWNERYTVSNADLTRFGVLSLNGETILPVEYHGLAAPSDESIPFADATGRWGYLGWDGRPRVTPRYRFATPYCDGLALVIDTAGGWWFLDASGQRLHDRPFAGASEPQSGVIWFRDEPGGLWGLMDTAFQTIVPPRFHQRSPFAGDWAVVSDQPRDEQPYGKLLIDTTGREIYRHEGELAETIVPTPHGYAWIPIIGGMKLLYRSGSMIDWPAPHVPSSVLRLERGG